MNRRMPRSHLAAAALAPLVLLLAACSGDATVATSTTRTSTSTSSQPTPSPTTSTFTRDPKAPPLSELLQGPLAPGRYSVAANGSPDLPRVILDVPKGFSSGGFFLDSDAGFLSYWGIAGIYKDPCTREGGTEPVSPSAESVVHLLETRLRAKSSATTGVTIGGQKGAYLELTSPEMDYDTCYATGYTYWDSGDGDRYVQEAGVLDRLWVLDVDGKVVILTTSSEPGTPAAAVRAATAVIEKATFTRADGSPLS